MPSSPGWRDWADAWFKLLGAIVFAYLILAQAVTGLRHFSGAATILVGAILLAYLILPAVAWLQRRLQLWAALSVVFVAGTLAITAVIYVLVPTVSAQFTSLIQNIPAMEHIVERFLSNPDNPLIRQLPTFMQSWVQRLPGQAAAQFQHNAVSYSSSLVNALGALTYLVALAIAIPVVAIYLIAEAPLIQHFILGRIPRHRRQAALDIAADIDTVLSGFVRGQLIVAAAVGVLATIALLILRTPYAVLIGAWAGVADIIPYVGPFAGALPAGIVALVDGGWGSVIGVAVAFTAINQLEGHVLGPRIVSRTVRVPTLGVIFALLIGAQLFGFLGLIVAVPLAGLVRVAIVRIFPRREPVEEQARE